MLTRRCFTHFKPNLTKSLHYLLRKWKNRNKSSLRILSALISVDELWTTESLRHNKIIFYTINTRVINKMISQTIFIHVEVFFHKMLNVCVKEFKTKNWPHFWFLEGPSVDDTKN